MPSYIDGLQRAALIARTLGATAHAAGQDDCVLQVSIDIARSIEAESDRELTPPRGTTLCGCCGQPLPVR